MTPGLRFVDLGWVSPVRSQTVWHAIAEVATPRSRATFSLCSPTGPYVSIGYHRPLAEVDLEACARRGLPVFRRRVGGGPVYCDASQLFFQLIVPAAAFPAVMERAWVQAMEPAVAAFRTLGVKAELVEGNDILADGRKICGTGAGSIGDALVFVGNVIFDFDHDAMADALAVPATVKREVARLTRLHLAPVGELAGRAVARSEAVAALTAAYADAFGPARRGELTDAEATRASELDDIFASPAWLASERAPLPSRIKIRGGVTVLVHGASWVTVVDGMIDRAEIAEPRLKPKATATSLAEALGGTTLERSALLAVTSRVCPSWTGAEAFIDALVSAYRRGA